jgi:hypothetical protein
MTIEIPEQRFEFANEVRNTLFSIDVSDGECPYAQYFPEGASVEKKQAIVYIAAITGLSGKRYINEVKAILREQNLTESRRFVRRELVDSMVNMSLALREQVSNEILSAQGATHIACGYNPDGTMRGKMTLRVPHRP